MTAQVGKTVAEHTPSAEAIRYSDEQCSGDSTNPTQSGKTVSREAILGELGCGENLIRREVHPSRMRPFG